jgi:hypothetical protein
MLTQTRQRSRYPPQSRSATSSAATLSPESTLVTARAREPDRRSVGVAPARATSRLRRASVSAPRKSVSYLDMDGRRDFIATLSCCSSSRRTSTCRRLSCRTHPLQCLKSACSPSRPGSEVLWLAPSSSLHQIPVGVRCQRLTDRSRVADLKLDVRRPSSRPINVAVSENVVFRSFHVYDAVYTAQLQHQFPMHTFDAVVPSC